MVKKFSVLHIALAISILVHAAVGVSRFAESEAFNRLFEDTPVEVILVNAKSTDVPDKAQAYAQASLSGGGDLIAGLATSPLPANAVTEVGDAIEDSRRQIDRLMEAQQQLLATLRNELAMMPPPDPRRDAGDLHEQAQEERRRQLLDQVAQIEKRINLQNARPKKRYIHPATKEVVYAMYYDQMRRRIEDRGTRNFPEHNGKRLYGNLKLMITVDAVGHIVETEVVESSNSALLDKRAIAIVEAAAPFGTFTNDMRRQADQLVVTSHFRFGREGLATKMMGQ